MEELILAALSFRKAKPWEYFDDSMLYAVALPDNDIAYCSIMGNAGSYFALGFYKGAKEFSTYLTSLEMNRENNPMLQFEAMQNFHCTNIEFVNANDTSLSSALKAEVKEVVKRHGLKMNRPNGWPNIANHNGNVISTGVDEKRAGELEMALRAGVALYESIEGMNDRERLAIGVDREESIYPSAQGGKLIPLLIPDAAGENFEISTTTTPAMMEEKEEKVTFADESLAEKIKEKKGRGIIQCRLIHTPVSVGNKEEFYYPQILLIVDSNSGQAFPLFEESNKKEEMLSNLAAAMEGNKPRIIEVEESNTEALLSDFCNKTGIRLIRRKELDELNDAWTHMFMMMSQMGM